MTTSRQAAQDTRRRQAESEARALIRGVSEALCGTISAADQAAAHRRRAAAWPQLAEAMPFDPEIDTALHCAQFDDLAQAEMLERRLARDARSSA